jgi:hypothetical protein
MNILRILHSEELCDLYRSSSVASTVKPRGYNRLDLWLGLM